MRVCTLNLKILILVCLINLKAICQQNTTTNGSHVLDGSVVYPQLNGILDFTPSTPAIQIQTDAGNFGKTKQFSLWGWFRQKNFFGFNSPSNIITLQNVQNFSSQDIEIGPFPNRNFPDCPVPLEAIKAQPELKNNPSVKNNPNCFPLELMNNSIITEQAKSFSITNDEILFVNYMLTDNDEVNPLNNKYELQFYLKNKDYKGDGSKSMVKYIIKGLPFVKNLWTFWAVAANYETGEVVLYMKVFGPNGYSRLQNETISYSNFELNEGSLLLIAATNRNAYFKTISGYIGEIAYIQMSSLFLKNVEFLWVAEMLVEDTLYDGVNSELLFDLYNKTDLMKSYGYDGSSVELIGNYQPHYMFDKNFLGVKFFSGSSFVVPDFQYRSSPFVSSHPFLFNFKYTESLPNELVLLEKGTFGQTGYLAIKLVKIETSKRFLLIEARSANRDFKWESSPIFEQGVSYQLVAGIVVSPNKTVHALMYLNGEMFLSEGEINFENYDFSYRNIIVLKNSEKFSGNIEFHRLVIMDNFSSVILKMLQVHNKRLVTMSGDCSLRTDYFHGSFGCLQCKKGINFVKTRTCVPFCPKGYRNNGTGVCIKCKFENCSDLPPLTWRVVILENNTYRLIPSRPLMPENVDITEFINIRIDNLEKNKDYTYVLVKGNNNEYIDINFDFKKSLYNQTVIYEFTPKEPTTFYDPSGNPIGPSKLEFDLKNFCRLEASTSQAIKHMALAIFIIMLVAIAISLMVLLCCGNKLRYKKENIEDKTPERQISSAIWKFLLHNWMKLQMVAFLSFLNSPLPCCTRLFLVYLYRYAVSWAHGMGPVWDSAHLGDSDYVDGVSNNLPPTQIAQNGAKAFLLHNMGIVFMFHLGLGIVYLVYKLIDCVKDNWDKSFFRSIVLIEFNLVIFGYMLFHMMAFVFSFLNLAFMKFTLVYFIFSFMIAVCYLLGNLYLY